jgi:RNA polymerase sigma factor (sigma-70 family)
MQPTEDVREHPQIDSTVPQPGTADPPPGPATPLHAQDAVGRAAEDALDQAVIDRVCRGERDAFAELVRRYTGMVFQIACRFFPSDLQKAEDVTQDAFMNAFSALGTFRPASFQAWLRAIANNAARDAYRKRDRDRHLVSDGDPAVLLSRGPGPEKTVSDRDEFAFCLASLPESYRQVLVLNSEGLSDAEIAARLEETLDAVRSRLSRARARLRRDFRRQEIGTSDADDTDSPDEGTI